jgi:hypothetical protein
VGRGSKFKNREQGLAGTNHTGTLLITCRDTYVMEKDFRVFL